MRNDTDFATPEPAAQSVLSDSMTRRATSSSDKKGSRLISLAIVFVVFVCTALLAMNVWLIVRARDAEIKQITSANTNLAKAVSQQIEGSITLAEHVISGIVFELERSDITADSLQRLQPVLVSHISELQGIKGLFVYDAQGRWLVNSEPSVDAGRNNSDREYFAFHRSSQSRRTLISGPVVSRSSGEWVIPVSRRINDPDGNFAGVVLATLSVKTMQNVLEQFQIGEQGAIALFREDQLLLRRPFKELDLGRRNTESQLLGILQSRRSGTTEGRSAIDGVHRIISFEHLANYPVTVTVAVGEDEALHEWKTAAIFQSTWVVLLSLAIGSSGVYLVQSMRRRLSAEQRLRRTRNALTEANERLSHLAQYDGLTGLANRRYFDSRFADTFQLAKENESLLAVVMIDVDEFKKYNDLYGHVEGDECLKSVARALGSALRRSEDFAARYGGEEMVLLLTAVNSVDAADIAEKARQAVLDLRIPHEATDLGIVSVSCGVAVCLPQAGSTSTALLRAADVALYEAKEKGKNSVVIEDLRLDVVLS